MSYRNPKQAIDQKYSVISKGLSRLYKTVGKNINKWDKLQDKNKAELDKRLAGQMKGFDTAFDKAVAESLAFTGSLSDRKEATTYQTQVNENLGIIRDALKEKLSNPDLTEDQIKKNQQLALMDVGQLSNAIVGLYLAEAELEKGKLNPNEAGANVSGKNNDLMLLLDIDEDVKLYNQGYAISVKDKEPYKLGEAKFFLGDFERDVPLTFALSEINHDEEVFNHLEMPDPDLLEQLTKDIIKKSEDFKIDGKVDIEKLKDYYRNDDAGNNEVMKAFGDIDPQGYLRVNASGAYESDPLVMDWEAFDQAHVDDEGLLADILVEEAVGAQKDLSRWGRDEEEIIDADISATEDVTDVEVPVDGTADSGLFSEDPLGLKIEIKETEEVAIPYSQTGTDDKKKLTKETGEDIETQIEVEEIKRKSEYTNATVDDSGKLQFTYKDKTISRDAMKNDPVKTNIDDGQDYIREMMNFENAMGDFSGGSVSNYGFSGTGKPGDKGYELLKYFESAKGSDKAEKALNTINDYIVGTDANKSTKLKGKNKTILQDLNITRAEFDALDDGIKKELVDWKFNSGRGTTDLVIIAGGGDWDEDKAFTDSSPTNIGDIKIAELDVAKLKETRHKLYKGRIKGLEEIADGYSERLDNDDYGDEGYDELLEKYNKTLKKLELAEKGYKNSQKYR